MPMTVMTAPEAVPNRSELRAQGTCPPVSLDADSRVMRIAEEREAGRMDEDDEEDEEGDASGSGGA